MRATSEATLRSQAELANQQLEARLAALEAEAAALRASNQVGSKWWCLTRKCRWAVVVSTTLEMWQVLQLRQGGCSVRISRVLTLLRPAWPAVRPCPAVFWLQELFRAKSVAEEQRENAARWGPANWHLGRLTTWKLNRK